MAQKRVTNKKPATRTSKKLATRKSKSAPKQKAPLAFGVTTIKSVSNYYTSNVEITNTQSGQIVNVPGEETEPSNVDIPWADDWLTFRDSRLDVEVRGFRTYYLFQWLGEVRYCTGLSGNDFRLHSRVPGIWRGDGERVLIIKSNGNFEIQRTG